MISLSLPRRKPRTAPRHAAAPEFAREQAPRSGPEPVTQQIPAAATVTFPAQGSHPYPEGGSKPGPQGGSLLPWRGTWAAPTPGLLADLADGLRNIPAVPDGTGTAPEPEPAALPATLLRAVPRDGGEGSSKEILSGWPAYAGRRATGTGQRVPGLLIGGDGDIRVYLENASPEWQDRLICEAVRMRLAGTQGAELVRLWDEHIAWAVRMRDVQAYGGFRAAPAPVAADRAGQ